MPTTTIIKGGNHKHIGDFTPDLPDNTIFNKVKTGCGMTHLALYNNVKYVIAMPFTALIKNKLASCKRDGINVCAVYANGKNYDDVLVFKGNKIMVTYDSFGIVTKALEDRGDLKDWKVLIDESHKLVDSGSFRTDAVQTILDNYEKYKSYVFGTATPIPDKHQLQGLKIIDKCTVKWNVLEDVTIHHLFKQKNLLGTVAKFVSSFLDGKHKTPKGHKFPNTPLNAHIFINSVNDIVQIIGLLAANGYDRPKDIKIVCSNRTENTNKIKKRLGSAYGISTINDPVKRLNFYTSTAFEGCDIEDEFGTPIIVSNAVRDFSKIDISITLPQIINRIRDSIFQNQAFFFYNKHKSFTNISETDYLKSLDEAIVRAKKDIDMFSQYPKNSHHRKLLLDDKSNPFIRSDRHNMWFNDAEIAYKKYSYHLTQSLYSFTENGIPTDFKFFNSIKYIYKPLHFNSSFNSSNPTSLQTPSFPSRMKKYVSLKDTASSGEAISLIYQAEIIRLQDDDSFLKKAYDALGSKKIKALKYRKGDITNEIILRDQMTSASSKIVKLLDLKDAAWISNKKAKDAIKKVYAILKIDKTAKATDLENLYSVKKTSINENGVKIYGYNILHAIVK